MHYGFGKSYTLPSKFTALNGTIQYYKLTTGVALTSSEPSDPQNPTVAEIKALEEAKANYLRVLEVLRTYGGQPVITKAEGTTLEFVLEQGNVFGKSGQMQPSEKDLTADAEEKIAEIFANVKAVVLVVDDEGHVIGEDIDNETTDLFVSVEVNEAF